MAGRGRFSAAPAAHAIAPADGDATEAEIQLGINHTVSLFCAVGHYSLVHKRHPFQLLLDVALTDMLRALAALETVPQARLHVRHFTKGQPPHLAIYDAATVQAFSWFSHQLWRYQAAYATFALPSDTEGILPEQWVRRKGTLYLTYSTSQMTEMAGLVAAIVHSQLLAHQTFGGGQPLLLVLDASLASRLPHFAQFLTTAADFGIIVALTAPSLASLHLISPAGSGETLAGQFVHQLWYGPRDVETDEYIATRYGTHLNAVGGPVPALTSEEVLGWTDETLLLLTKQERPYLLIGQPVKLPAAFPQRQPPLPPKAGDTPRTYDSWLPPLSGLTEQVQAALVDKGVMPGPAETEAAALEKRDDREKETAVSQAPGVQEDNWPPYTNPAAAPDNMPDQAKQPAEDGAASEKSLNIVRAKFR